MSDRQQIRFRVYCDREKRRYYDVRIFATKALMYEHFQKSNVDTEWQEGRYEATMNFEAIAQFWRRIGKRCKPENIGQILFYASAIGSGTVSHEMTHAVIYWAQYVKMNLAKLPTSKRIDERFAWAQGFLVTQFWRKFYRAQSRVAWLKTR
jgi:hypothetical protein